MLSLPGSHHYFDVGQGNAALVVAPSGETVLLDADSERAADRVIDAVTRAGIKKIDYLVVSHFEGDHMAGAPRIAAKIPVVTWVDHGECVTYGKSDDWWRERRGPWMRGNGWGKNSDRGFDEYRQAQANGHHMVVKPR